MERREFLRYSALALAGMAVAGPSACATTKGTRSAGQLPNIVYVLADDMGYGDAACYDPQYNKVPTPNIDRLASQGMRFTAAHTPSAVCSPTRYGILTGRYPWRSKLQKGVLGPYAPPLIDPDRLTVPGLLKQQGYHSTCIGKWHLGWDWPKDPVTKKVQFDGPIPNGPITRGFDAYFGVDIPNYPPYVFLENDRVTVQPSEQFNGNLAVLCPLKGPMAPGWRFDEIMPTLTKRAVATINGRAKSGQPFFLYFALTIPHEPLAPSEQFKGKSGISSAADLNMEVDWALGQVMEALEKSGIADNTLLIFTTDNGHSPTTGLKPFEQAGHRVSGPFRGVKSTAWEGGDRVPFIARWPDHIKLNSRCDRLICHTDLIATVAELTGAKLPPNAGEDSVSMLPLLQNPDAEPVREDVVTLSVEGRFSIIHDSWKLILSPGAGGYGSAPSDWDAQKQGLPQGQLYDLAHDISEKNNLQAQHPEIVDKLRALLEKYIEQGRSTAGPPQRNDVEPNLNKPIVDQDALRAKMFKNILQKK